MDSCWEGFKTGDWCENINVSDFIKLNYSLYEGNDEFLENASEKTKIIWNKCLDLLKEEHDKRVLDIDVDNMAGINKFEPG